MKTVKVLELVQDPCVLGRYEGGELRRQTFGLCENGADVAVDFKGVIMLKQSAADEFVGRIVRYHKAEMKGVVFVNCESDVKRMLQAAVDNPFSVAEIPDQPAAETKQPSVSF